MKKKIVIILIVLVLIIVIITGITYKHDKNSNIVALEYDNLKDLDDIYIDLEDDKDFKEITLYGNFSNNIVNNEKEALLELKEVETILEISNVEKEFKFKMENGTDDYKYYRMQQYYNDVLVDGMQLIVSADKNGNVESISGNYLKLDNFNIEPKIQEDELDNIIIKKYENNIEIENKELVIEKLEDTPVLVWKNLVSGSFNNLSEHNYYIYISAETGEVLKEEKLVFYDYESVTGSAKVDGKDIEFSVEKNINEEEYFLYDDKRNIGVYDNNNDGAFVRSTNRNSWEDTYSIKAYHYIQFIYDWYNEKISYNLTSKYPIKIVNNIKDFNNARFIDLPLNYTRIEIGAGDDVTFRHFSNGIDVLGHELTHAYVYRVVGYNFLNGEINEGYADVLGVIIENDYNKTDDDWILGEDVRVDGVGRNLTYPESLEQPSIVNGKYYKKLTLDEHDNCTILGHTAYLMWKNGFTLDEISKIFAESCNSLTIFSGYNAVANELVKISNQYENTRDKTEILKAILTYQNIKKYSTNQTIETTTTTTTHQSSSGSYSGGGGKGFVEKKEDNNVLTVGNYTLQYGTYKGIYGAEGEILTIKSDGTAILKSSNSTDNYTYTVGRYDFTQDNSTSHVMDAIIFKKPGASGADGFALYVGTDGNLWIDPSCYVYSGN